MDGKRKRLRVEMVSKNKNLIAVISATGSRVAESYMPCRPAANLRYAL